MVSDPNVVKGIWKLYIYWKKLNESCTDVWEVIRMLFKCCQTLYRGCTYVREVIWRMYKYYESYLEVVHITLTYVNVFWRLYKCYKSYLKGILTLWQFYRSCTKVGKKLWKLLITLKPLVVSTSKKLSLTTFLQRYSG